ncbi:hypothetical protein HYH07_21080 [Bradyrhizobium sp. BR 10261]|nr:hypothetical protein [Bradyrhizobium sp. BR 10261]
MIVEGPSDQAVIGSYFEGAALRAMIYPMPSVDIDKFTPSSRGGDKGRVLQVASFLDQQRIDRVLCVVDKDGESFHKFWLSPCCLTTDLSCVEIYPLDPDDLAGYLSRAHLVQLSTDALAGLINTSRIASTLGWLKDQRLPGRALARIDRSLEVNAQIISLDVKDWLTRSIKVAPDRESWMLLEDDLLTAEQNFTGDSRALINVHVMDTVLRFWFRRVHGINLAEGWLERHLRGQATFASLSKHEFFQQLKKRLE